MARRKAVVHHEELRTSTEDVEDSDGPQRAVENTPPSTPMRQSHGEQQTPKTSPRKKGRKAHVSVTEVPLVVGNGGGTEGGGNGTTAGDTTSDSDIDAYDACDEADPDQTPRAAAKLNSPSKLSSPQKSKGNRKRTSEQVREYLERESELLACFFARDYDASAGSVCTCGRSHRSQDGDEEYLRRLWRCSECFHAPVCCIICISESHKCNPFHRVQKWNGSFFERRTLRDTGLVFYLGHAGDRCPEVPKDADATKMTICDLQGFQAVDVLHCRCAGAASELSQLVSAQLFPATLSRPRSAFTWTLMEDLRLDTVQSKKPIYDYFTKLVRLSRNADVNADKKGYENLARAARFYNAAMRVRQSGQGQDIDKVIQTLYPGLLYAGSVMLPCVSCPHAGFNTPDNVEALVKDPRQEHKYRANLGMDGNYKLYQKHKLMDVADVSIFDGRGAFVLQSALAEFRDKFGNYKETEGSCPSVDRMHARTRVRGCLVAGLFAVLCTRHLVFPGQSLIDILVGERFADIDLALMRAYGPRPAGWVTTLLSFDKNCQYWINFRRRIEDEFGEDSPEARLAAQTLFCVPKFHISNHVEDCQFQFHPGHVTGAGRVSGEEVEPPWAELGQAGAQSRDTNPGHRHEIIEDAVSDWNFKRLVGMARSLLKRAKDVAFHLPRTKAFFTSVSENVDQERVAHWLREFPNEAAEVTAEKEIKSRFKSDSSKHPARQEVLDLLREETRLLGRGKGALHMLHKGVKLSLRQARIKRRIKDNGSELLIRNERSTLRRDIMTWRALRNKHIPVDNEFEEMLAAEPDEEDLGKPEKIKLLLPSDYTAAERQELGLEHLAAQQLKIHEGEAEAAIAELCLAIRTFRTDVQFKHAELSGQTTTTRAQAALEVTNAARTDAANKYRFHHKKMLALGLPATDLRYQSLEDSDLVAFNSTRKPEKLGTGKVSESWIWRGNKDVSFVDERKRKRLNDLADDDLRVLYFRSLSQYLRWGEDGEILLEDFKRSVKSFANYRDIWKVLGDRAQHQSIELEQGAVEAVGLVDSYMADLRRGVCNAPPPESAGTMRYRAQVERGKRAYAMKKAAFFESMRKKSEEGLAEAEGLIGVMVEDFGKHAQELNNARERALHHDDNEPGRKKRRRKGK